MRRAMAAAGLAMAIVVCALAPPAAAAVGVRATAVTLRSLQVDTSGSLAPQQAEPWRFAADADRSGAVGAEELSIFTSVFDAVVEADNATEVDAYAWTWARENASGAKGFTVETRANLSAFVFAQASAIRSSASWDGAPGRRDRVETTFTGLAVGVTENRSLSVILVVIYLFPALDPNELVHRLTIALPAGVNLRLSVGGGLQVLEAQNMDAPTMDAPQEAVWGTTTATAPVFLVKERAVSNDAFLIVVAAVLAPAALVGVIAVFALPRMKVEDAPLLVEPKYK